MTNQKSRLKIETKEVIKFIGPHHKVADSIRANQLWDDIKRAARQDPCLQDMLEEVLVYYALRHGVSNG